MGKTVKLVKLNCFKGFQTRVKLPEGNPITKDKSIHVIFFIQIGGLIFEARSPPAVFAAGDNAFVEVHGWIRPQQGAAEPGWLMSLNLFLVFKICLDKSKWPNRSYWLVQILVSSHSSGIYRIASFRYFESGQGWRLSPIPTRLSESPSTSPRPTAGSSSWSSREVKAVVQKVRDGNPWDFRGLARIPLLDTFCRIPPFGWWDDT